jgi:hypothetical protein
MKNTTIVIKSNAMKLDDPYLSSLFHIYDIGLYLISNNFNVLYWVSENSFESYLDWDFRYMKQIPMIYEEPDFLKNYILLTDYLPENVNNFKNIKKILLINHYNLWKSFVKCNIYEEIIEKCFVLTDKRLDQSFFINYDDGNYFLENQRIYEYEFGLYTKYLVNTFPRNYMWYQYNFNIDSNVNVFMENYIKTKQIQYTKTPYIDSYNKFSGLLYGSNKDYFSRLPFEFSYHNKKIVMFDSDPTFRNLTTHQLWNHSYIIQDIPMLNINLNFFKN